MKIKNLLGTIVFSQIAILSLSQSTSYDIRLNQAGFLTNSLKYAAIVNSQTDSFKVMTSDLSSTVFRGKFLPSAYYSSSDENVSIADFTLLQTSGNYVLVVDGLGKSVSFTINDDVLVPLSKAALKGFYYNRASIPLTGEFAGVYAREEGHPDTVVVQLFQLPEAGTMPAIITSIL